MLSEETTTSSNNKGGLSLLDGGDEREEARIKLAKAEEELQRLCAHHAGTFVQVEHRSDQFQLELKTWMEILQKLEQTSAVNQELFHSTTKERWIQLCEEHRTKRRTLLQHEGLLELLELPSLMDACVQGQYYQDALHLLQLATSFSSNPNHIVQGVCQDIFALGDALEKHLCQRLSQNNVTMPLCLEIMTALRRYHSILSNNNNNNNNNNTSTALDNFDEKLQVEFLESRDIWVSSLQLPTTNDSYYSLLDYLDSYRTRCFEVATQFLAIFSSETSKVFLRMWVMRRIQSYLQLLRKTTLITDMNVLANVWEAAIFFASCMAKSLQCNFAPLLPATLDPHCIRLLKEKWSTQKLQETLQLSREHSLPNLLTNTLFSTTTTITVEEEYHNEEGYAPPKSLLVWPPLARWVNSYLTGLNDLKRCLVPSVFPKIRSLQKQRKEEVSKLLSTHLIQCKQACVSSTLSQSSEQMITIYDSIVIPYMDHTLEYALGTILPPPPQEEEEQQQQKETEETNDTAVSETEEISAEDNNITDDGNKNEATNEEVLDAQTGNKNEDHNEEVLDAQTDVEQEATIDK